MLDATSTIMSAINFLINKINAYPIAPSPEKRGKETTMKILKNHLEQIKILT
jgi:hypothetical protein